MSQLSPPLRQLVAVAILALLCFAPLGVLLWMYSAYQDNLVAISERRVQLARFKAIAAFDDALKEMEKGEPEAIGAKWFVAEPDPGIAIANLQAKLRTIAQERGVEIMQAGDIKPVEVGPLRYIGLTLEMNGQPEAIQATLQAFENGEPLLISEKVTLRSGSGGGDPRYDPIPLYVMLEVWAAMNPPSPSQRKAVPE